jgi:hypothetical protein
MESGNDDIFPKVQREGSDMAVRIELDPMVIDPVPEILRSFRRAEISESEKNALLALVCDPDEEDVLDAETCVLDPFADQQTLPWNDD